MLTEIFEATRAKYFRAIIAVSNQKINRISSNPDRSGKNLNSINKKNISRVKRKKTSWIIKILKKFYANKVRHFIHSFLPLEVIFRCDLCFGYGPTDILSLLAREKESIKRDRHLTTRRARCEFIYMNNLQKAQKDR